MIPSFPLRRMRRLRKHPLIRDMVRETVLTLNDLIMPVIVRDGDISYTPITSMPGIGNFSVTTVVEECHQIAQLGIPAVILFGVPESKDMIGSGAWAEQGVVQRAIRNIREELGNSLILIADTCLCEYTSHGHCGPYDDGEVDNDKALELLAKTAVSQAKAGADMIAPSDMMDGRVGVIRQALDNEGFNHIPIMSYAVKYASSLYGPFREAAQSAPQFGNRQGYQMDPANRREAICEAILDVEEGADILMVKPALSNLDIIADLRNNKDLMLASLPLAAYQVSGEYAMIKAAAQNEWLDEQRTALELLTAIKRAGADIIITYFAKQLAQSGLFCE